MNKKLIEWEIIKLVANFCLKLPNNIPKPWITTNEEEIALQWNLGGNKLVISFDGIGYAYKIGDNIFPGKFDDNLIEIPEDILAFFHD